VTGEVPGAPPKQTESTRADVEKRIFINQNGIDVHNPRPPDPATGYPGDEAVFDQHIHDMDQWEKETAADVARTHGRLPEAAAAEMNKYIHYRAIVNGLLDSFTPEERAQYVGVVAPSLYNVLQPARNDRDFALFRTLNADLRSKVFEIGGRRAPTGPELDILGPILPSGRERSPAEYEAALQIATQAIDNAITGIATLGNASAEQLTPQNIDTLVGHWMSMGPGGIHYGPYPWQAKQPGVSLNVPATTTPTAPPPTTTTVSPFAVDQLYTIAPSPAGQ